MESDGKLLNLVLLIVVIVGGFLAPLIQQWRRQRAMRGGEDAGPDLGTAEPAAPGEERGTETFGGPEDAELWAEEAAEETTAVTPRPLPVPEAEERTLAKAPVPPAAVKAPSVPPPAGSRTSRSRLMLETRLIADRRWTPGAKLIIARELLDRPKCVRPRRLHGM